ncbi:MAG: transposase [Moorellales bacterium]
MDEFTLEPIKRLTKDLKQASRVLSHREARYLVTLYYLVQRDRIRAGNQVKALEKRGEPREVITWIYDNVGMLERDIYSALDAYSSAHPVGVWAKSIVGIGPVLSAGLLAHIDIEKAPTAGHIWRFAGLDPTVEWLGEDRARTLVQEVLGKSREVADEHLAKLAVITNRRAENLKAICIDPEKGRITCSSLIKGLARCPYNQKLKVLCWKIGESFVKVQNRPDDVYGKLYVKRKLIEHEKNERGEYADQAEAKLARFNISKDTEAYKWYSQGKLPPAHIHQRAKRWVVKLFLAHWHEVAYWYRYGVLPPAPYPMAVLGHVHYVDIPNLHLVPGLAEARCRAGRIAV